MGFEDAMGRILLELMVEGLRLEVSTCIAEDVDKDKIGVGSGM